MKGKLIVKVCSYRSPQRYAVVRTLRAALVILQNNYPDLELEIIEIRDVQEILKITPVLILPSLVINDRLVCTGRFPKKEEVTTWFISGWEEMNLSSSIEETDQ
jgi:hypothetical protein